jgi:plastocyanin
MTRGTLAEVLYRLIYIGEHNLDYYGQSGSNTSQQAITIQNFSYQPSSLTVTQGTTVNWTNFDSATHTVTSDSGNDLNSQDLNKGDIYSHTFSQTGTFYYHCKYHPNMKGTIVVQPLTSYTGTSQTTSTAQFASSLSVITH